MNHHKTVHFLKSEEIHNKTIKFGHIILNRPKGIWNKGPEKKIKLPIDGKAHFCHE